MYGKSARTLTLYVCMHVVLGMYDMYVFTYVVYVCIKVLYV